MKAIVLAVLLLTAGSAHAEMFELSGKLVCGFTSDGKLETLKLSMRGMIEHAFESDAEFAKRVALVYDTADSELVFARRCDGASLELLASNESFTGSTGDPKNGKIPYSITQILDVADWDVSAETGFITCNFSGQQDEDTAAHLSAKGTCNGSLTIFRDGIGYCSLQTKVGKRLKITNDCKT